MDNELLQSCSDVRRTRLAIFLSAAIGLAIGYIFGSLLGGWILALAGAYTVPSFLCFLAPDRHHLVRFAYAASVPVVPLLWSISRQPNSTELWWLPLQFFIVFVALLSVTYFAVGFWTLLIWADDRFSNADDKFSIANRRSSKGGKKQS